MNQIEKASQFAKLHISGEPGVLFNIWDVGSAQAVEQAGAKAIATGSWSVARAQGYVDGEVIPLHLVETTAQPICSAVELPVTIDFERGYGDSGAEVAANVGRIMDAGAVGINFEDRIVQGAGLYEVAAQCKWISAIRSAADQRGVPLFVNARTDLFLHASADTAHDSLMDDALARATAYAAAGATGFFAPGLVNERLIRQMCRQSSVPVNIMMMGASLTLAKLAALGVSRISYGRGPFRSLMSTLTERAAEVVTGPKQPGTEEPNVDSRTSSTHSTTGTVTRCGRICMGRRKIDLSTVFAGQKVGVKEVDDKIWLVSFMQYDLGFFDHETGRLESVKNTFEARVLPMSPV